jgi:hypothetical protein
VIYQAMKFGGVLLTQMKFTVNNISFNELSYAKSMIPTKDKGMLISGLSYNFKPENIDDIFVMKTDSLCRFAAPVVVDVKSFDTDTIPFFSDTFEFKYFPNPSAGNVQFEIYPTEPLDSLMSLSINDLYGRNVFEKIITEKEFNLNLLNLPDGLYVFRIKKGKKILGKGKIVLSRMN